jgi:GT2 family glycosyltransferase
MKLSVVVVNWNSRADLEACLVGLLAGTHRDLEVIVVDNGSHDGSPELVRERFPAVLLLAEQENLGFAEACNRGIEASSAPWVAMLNNDAVPEPRWAEALVAAAERAAPDCGMLQSLILFAGRPGTVNSTGIELSRGARGGDRDEGRPRDEVAQACEIFCPTAGAAAYRRSMLEEVRLAAGYFDPEHFLYYEDLDLGWRARLRGWTAWYVPGSVVHHRWHGSSDRHGKRYLRVMARSNRMRTLLKNGSPRLLLTSAPASLWDLGVVLLSGGALGVARWIAAAMAGARQRGEVEALATVARQRLEERWIR